MKQQPMLENKTAIITGATKGIGKGIAISFAKKGCSIALIGMNEQRAKEVLKECQENQILEDQQFAYFLSDVSNTEDVKTTFEKIYEEFTNIDILINNAGIVMDNLLLKMKEEDFDRVLEVNLKSVFNTCKAILRPMMKQRSGKIINISSVVGLTGNAGQANYAASKAGMNGFTKSLAKEVAKRNIQVNSIAPGYIQTLMTDALSEEVKNKILQSIPMNKIGSADDIANAAAFLASDLSSYITGQVLVVDGGMVI